MRILVFAVGERLGGGLAAAASQPILAVDLYFLLYCYSEIDCFSLKLLVSFVVVSVVS